MSLKRQKGSSKADTSEKQQEPPLFLFFPQSGVSEGTKDTCPDLRESTLPGLQVDIQFFKEMNSAWRSIYQTVGCLRQPGGMKPTAQRPGQTWA